MPVKSSRFSRKAYARRAALLAEDLREWYAIYHNRIERSGDWWTYDTEADVIVERERVLSDLVDQLQHVSIELATLR
jgi:hypothetical protein